MQVMYINSSTISIRTKEASFIIKLAGMQNVFGRMVTDILQPEAQQMGVAINDPTFLSTLDADKILQAIAYASVSDNLALEYNKKTKKYTYNVEDIFNESMASAQKPYIDLIRTIKNILETQKPGILQQPIANLLPESYRRVPVNREEENALSPNDAPVMPAKNR